MRGRAERGSRKLDTSAMREALRDRRFWVGLGIVYAPNGEQHWETDDDIGVLVNVELMPDREPLQCRLGALGGGDNYGVWRVPPVGSEVAVLIPNGAFGANDALLVGVVSHAPPTELDADTLVVKAPKVVIIADGAVEVGQKGLGATDGVVHGSGIDPFTGSTYTVLGSTSSRLKAKKT